jgi:hypothetical protein
MNCSTRDYDDDDDTVSYGRTVFYKINVMFVFVFVLMGWSLLPNALRPFKIYCAPPNFGIIRT